MKKSLRLGEADQTVWDEFTKDVTLLGQPQASVQPAVALVVAHDLPAGDTLDLHGLTLAQAHIATMDFLADATGRSVTIVTGLSGAIKREFELWFDRHPTVKRIEAMNGGGAFRIFFRKKK